MNSMIEVDYLMENNMESRNLYMSYPLNTGHKRINTSLCLALCG